MPRGWLIRWLLPIASLVLLAGCAAPHASTVRSAPAASRLTAPRTRAVRGAQARATPATPVPPLAAIVDGAAIPLWEFTALVRLNLQTRASGAASLTVAAARAVRARTLNQLVDEALLNRYAVTHHLIASPAAVAMRLRVYRVQAGADYTTSLARLGVTAAQFRRIVARNLTAQAVIERVVAAIRAPAQRIQVVTCIVTSEWQARAIAGAVRHGADLSLLAAQQSSDATLRRLAGQLPALTRAEGSALYGAAWAATAFALPVGAVSPPLRLPTGWVVLQVVQRQPESGLMQTTLAHFMAELRRKVRIRTYVQ